MRAKSTKLFLACFAVFAAASMQGFLPTTAAQQARSYTPNMKDGSRVTLNGVRARRDRETRFIVRIENLAGKDLQTAKDGRRWPFALSPGMWVVHKNEVRLYGEGRPSVLGLEAQAEDGNPAEIIKYLDSRHNHMQHGVFNTPVGASAPAPILPGQAYEFSLTATPGMRLSLITMFGQSNDWFYAADPEGIDLFKNGRPVSGDITDRFRLYDAGTEIDEEPGVGVSQAPRQKAANTGEAENGKVHKARKSAFYTRNGELFRVTITPEVE